MSVLNSDKRYIVKRTITGKLVVMVSFRVPDIMPGAFRWTRYKEAGLDELAEVMWLLTKGGMK
jgi:hypothetical protein